MLEQKGDLSVLYMKKPGGTFDGERKEIEAEMYATMRELIDQLHEIK